MTPQQSAEAKALSEHDYEQLDDLDEQQGKELSMSTKSKAVVSHTPGLPWSVDLDFGKVKDANGNTIVTLPAAYPPYLEPEDILQLIAAAPTMLDALKKIYATPELINAGLGSDAYHAYVAAGEAIAKAEGR